jgi:hypothetical protein
LTGQNDAPGKLPARYGSKDRKKPRPLKSNVIFSQNKENTMKSLKVTLWIAAIGCLVAIPFIALPWTVLEKFILFFDVGTIPNDPLAMYLLRVSCGVYGLIGVYFVILAKNPLNYGPMLNIGAYGLVLFGLLSLLVGLGLGLSPKVYAGDSLSGLILGIAVIIFSSKAKKDLIK